MEALTMMVIGGGTLGVALLAGSLAVHGALRLVRHMARASTGKPPAAVSRVLS
jgi:hypothetical protein